jgi:hypothetical protein
MSIVEPALVSNEKLAAGGWLVGAGVLFEAQQPVRDGFDFHSIRFRQSRGVRVIEADRGRQIPTGFRDGPFAQPLFFNRESASSLETPQKRPSAGPQREFTWNGPRSLDPPALAAA